ncbi:AMP-binding protein [Gordonia sp. PKS22-38]|uniref:AMP-binding protein n=1 Tax=Gordonia prachuapensis TaxID=3115651 RepID=A0ABU7MXG7_9ACTN|nr:AMP-binding protein [Gordonia sp. PKS22-38]
MDTDAIATLPDRRASAEPDGRCLADSETTLSNADFADAVSRAAGHFSALGVRRGDVVAVMMPNRVELVVSMFAAWRLGAACTPMNPALTSDEALYQLTDSHSAVVVADEASVTKLGDATATVVPVADLGATSGASTVHGADAADVALLIYTSGTTGRPKGVILDHANLTAMASMVIEWFGMTSADRALLILPLFHINGIMASIVSPLLVGGSSMIAPRFDPAAFWGIVAEEQPTFTSGVPTIYAMLANLPADVVVEANPLRFVVCGAAPMPPGLISAFEDRYGVPVVEGYGLSETSAACTINPVAGERRSGSVGLALPGVDIRIVAEGVVRSVGESGEVEVHGPNVMRGYLGRPEATADALQDGWLRTGDVGRLDEDGYLYLVDRVKDIIIRGGENIYPQEVENVILRHPAVAEAAVVGRPDDTYGEQPVAVVVATPGASLDAAEMETFCRSRLARYKVPREIHVVDALPRNSVGKVVKGTVRDMIAEVVRA